VPDIQKKILQYIDKVDKDTLKGAVTAAMVARAVGLDEQTALVFLLHLSNKGKLLPPRFYKPLTSQEKV
jgi:urease accessory protein UreF